MRKKSNIKQMTGDELGDAFSCAENSVPHEIEPSMYIIERLESVFVKDQCKSELKVSDSTSIHLTGVE